MIPALILFNVFLVIPVLLALTNRELERIQKTFGTTATTYFKYNRYEYNQFLAIIHLYWLTFSIIELLLIGVIGLVDDKSVIYIKVMVGTLLSGASCSCIILYRNIHEQKVNLLSNRNNLIALPSLSFVFGLIATSMSLNYIEEITGYSSTNFHSTEMLKWVIVLLLFMMLILFLNYIFIFMYTAKKTSKRDTKKTLKQYINNRHIPIATLCSFMFITGLLAIPFVIYIKQFPHIFRWTFVKMNFHYFPHEQCKDIPKGSLVSHLLKNKFDKNNFLVASNENEKWAFRAKHCKITQKIDSTDAPVSTSS